MESLISLEVFDVSFASDSSDLISMIEKDDDWPAFAVEMTTFRFLLTFFPSFRISFIPRFSNVRTDSLAKKARVRGSLFSHVSSSAPVWVSLEESNFPIT